MENAQQFTISSTKTSILVVDDHPIVREGLTKLINLEKDLVVVAGANSAFEAMKAIKKLEPDMVITDLSLEDKSGIELIKDIKIQYPDMPVLVVSMHDESIYAERVLRAGARGYIMKKEATEKLIDAIRKVRSGREYIGETMVTKMVYKLVGRKPQAGESTTDCLSDRELEVFLLVGKGFSTRQISEKLHLSVKTIETYRAHIKQKLNLTDAAELLQHAIQWANN